MKQKVYVVKEVVKTVTKPAPPPRIVYQQPMYPTPATPKEPGAEWWGPLLGWGILILFAIVAGLIGELTR